MKYAALTDTYDKAKSVLAGSCVYSDSSSRAEMVDAWRASRHFIIEAIDDSGSILDYGCANGYLLRSLMEWSSHNLTPYGVDVDDSRLSQARTMFPGLEANFVNNLAEDARDLRPRGFDYVYWAVGDNVDFQRADHQRWLSKVERLVAPRGRLILGFYSDAHSNRRRQEILPRLGRAVAGRLRNPRGPESLVWLERVSG